MGKILCAAVYYPNGKIYCDQPVNITNGFVTCGRRHNICVTTMELITGAPSYAIKETCIFGFITSDDRFVDRYEGYQIAKEANQLLLKPCEGCEETLTSEDLY